MKMSSRYSGSCFCHVLVQTFLDYSITQVDMWLINHQPMHLSAQRGIVASSAGDETIGKVRLRNFFFVIVLIHFADVLSSPRSKARFSIRHYRVQDSSPPLLMFIASKRMWYLFAFGFGRRGGIRFAFPCPFIIHLSLEDDVEGAQRNPSSRKLPNTRKWLQINSPMLP